MENAYLAIGFDSWGNFKNEIGTTQNGEQEYGVPKQVTDYNSFQHHITLRAGSFPGQRKGYPVIYTTQTTGEKGGKITQAILN